MSKLLSIAIVVFIVAIHGCSIPTPTPASTEMDINVNGSEWERMSNEQREEAIGGYN